ncbi:T9SS type A sorting domain-containing protein [Psychroflexus torquis]|nr:T9SS type A sorting domain-containing protein [Psychroflexus torquis]
MKHIYLLSMLMIISIGLRAQVILEADINSGIENSGPTNLTNFNDELIFRATNGDSDNGGSGRELFRFTTDGSASLITDLRPEGSSSPNNLVVYNNKLFFTAFDTNKGGVDLFSYNGTSANSEGLYPNQFSGLFNPIVAYGKIYFVGFDSNFTPNKFIEYDGTTGGEVSGSGSESVVGGNFIDYNNGFLLYMASDNLDVGIELFFYDLDSSEFSLIKDIDEGTGSSSISEFIKLDGDVYFEAESQVWKTNGSNEGTVLIESIANAGIDNTRAFFAWNGDLYFEGDAGSGDQLWKYNPQNELVIQLSNNTGENMNHDPGDYIVFDGFIYYSAEDETDSETHLWRTNGTNVEQLNETFIDVSELEIFDNRIFFRANEEGITGNELFSFDPNTLSIQSENPFAELKLYPNPTQDLVRFTNNLNGVEYNLYNLKGQLIDNGVIENNSINLSSFKGTLILNVTIDQKQKSFKIISN